MIAIAALTGIVCSANPALAQARPPQDRINTALTRARQVGIPVALLQSKIAEGQAKGVPIDRLATAVERRLAALERAHQAMAGQHGIGHADLAIAADAVESGVGEAVLTRIADVAPRERRAVAIAALTQLVQLGHVPEAALERVRQALQRGPEALLNLPAEAGHAAGRRGGPPDVQTPGAAGARGGAPVGPPAGVPAPGKPPQSARPGGPPAKPGPSSPPPAGGRGGSGGA
jgi:hypothetical protein